MTYCSVNKVRLVSGLESSDVTDEDIRDLRDEVATSELNEDINQTVRNERVDRQISGAKENSIDGSNTTFYLKKPHQTVLKLGDKNDDGVVNGEDLDVYYIDDDDNRVTDVQITVEDVDEGRFEMVDSDGTALEEDVVGKIFADYEAAPVDEDGYGNDFSSEGPDMNVETACAQLTAAYCFTNVEATKLKDFSIGDVSINTQSEGAQVMRSSYMETIKRITQRQVVQTGQNENSVSGAFKSL